MSKFCNHDPETEEIMEEGWSCTICGAEFELSPQGRLAQLEAVAEAAHEVVVCYRRYPREGMFGSERKLISALDALDASKEPK